MKNGRKVWIIVGVIAVTVTGIVSYRWQQYNQFLSRVEGSSTDFTQDDVGLLIQVLEDGAVDTDTRIKAIKALGHIGPEAKDAVPALLPCVGVFGMSGASAPDEALAAIGPPAVPGIINALQGGSEESDRLAWILGTIGPEAAEAVPVLCDTLKQNHSSGRRRAAWALGQIHADSKTAVPALIAALKDEDASVRQNAAQSLYRFTDVKTDSVSALAALLKDKDKRTRSIAQAALVMLSEKADNESVRKAAEAAFAGSVGNQTASSQKEQPTTPAEEDQPAAPAETAAPVEIPNGSDEPSADPAKAVLSVVNSIGMRFVPISAGTFTMGEGQTAHKVTLTQAFELGVYEVTQEQYKKVMGTTPSEFKGPQKPVEQVSWDDAVEFCRKLSELPGEKSTGYVYRLPTEAEWEYACRAGTTTAYSFGDSESELGDYAWYDKNSGKTTHPVGGKKPNAWGLYDMHGNVFEWCHDWYGDYPSGSVTDPTGVASGSDRVYRGGSWYDYSVHCRSAYRGRNTPDLRGIHLGFRVLRSSIK
jgi:formylglycine-generating enzyme required for sulfatase activity